jgi:hypothetical protein
LSKEVTQALKHTGYLPDINAETSSWGGPSANHNNHQVGARLKSFQMTNCIKKIPGSLPSSAVISY